MLPCLTPPQLFPRRPVSLYLTALLTVALLASPGFPGGAAPGPGPEPPTVTRLEPAEALRGTAVTVHGARFPPDRSKITIRLNEVAVGPPDAVGPKGESFSFRIPPRLPLGSYAVRVVFTLDKQSTGPILVPVPGAKAGTPDRLRVVSDSPGPVKLAGVYPIVGYPNGGSYGFRLLGENFSPVAADNVLVVEGHGEVPVTWVESEANAPKPPDKLYGQFVSTRQLNLWGLPQAEHQGTAKVRVRVGDSVSDAVPVTLAQVGKRIPLLVAVAVVLALGGLIGFLATRGMGSYRIADQTYGAFTTLFLDKETDSYSLSKLQLYLWTAAAVFGYVYLTVARSLIQWDIEFPPVPGNLPGILFISASTTVLARGITSARGPNGAGAIYPSLADFITSGGVVVAERFQFLVWTLLGVAAFIFLILASDPAQIHDLPQIPEGFLYLMGISSAGYLGGKLARKPGPVIDTIEAQEGSLVLDIQGRNLSRSASFTIDDVGVTYDLVQPTLQGQPVNSFALTAPGAPQKDARLEVVHKDEKSQDPDFAAELRLTITDSAKANVFRTGKHKLTLVNPDGQQATWEFQAKPRPIPVAAPV